MPKSGVGDRGVGRGVGGTEARIGSKVCYKDPQVLVQVRGCWRCEGPRGGEESGTGEGVSEEREIDRSWVNLTSLGEMVG